jgi:hypothetical protein
MIGVVIGAVIGFAPIDPINGFSRGAVINGVVSVQLWD